MPTTKIKPNERRILRHLAEQSVPPTEWAVAAATSTRRATLWTLCKQGLVRVVNPVGAVYDRFVLTDSGREALLG